MESIDAARNHADPGETASGIDWLAIWQRTARHLGRHAEIGLSTLLTEDVLRFAVVQELVASGVDPSGIEVEWRRPTVRDAVDLVVTSPELAAIEFKYPREPRQTNAAWTQHLGESLKDFYRLASMPAGFSQRWCVQLWSRRVNAYFDGVGDSHRFGIRYEARAAHLPRPLDCHGSSEWVSSDLLLIAHAVEQAAANQPL